MGYGLCFLQGSRSWLARLVPVLAVVLSFSISHGLLSVPIITLILLLFISILSLLLFKSWTKTIVDHLQVEESHGTDEIDLGSSPQEYVSHAGEVKEDEEESKTLTVQEEANNESNQGFFIRSSADLYYSGRESMDRLSSDEEDHDARERPVDCSDDSISDEEGLIEIAITCGESVGTTLPKKDSNLMNLKNCCKREEFLLADVYEMNEEDNLIEIDIYMGSIKCSSFGNLDIRRKKLL